MKRYLLKQDEDCHWYLIAIDRETEFETMCADAYANDKFDSFEDAFGSFRIDGPHNLSFVGPCDSAGEELP